MCHGEYIKKPRSICCQSSSEQKITMNLKLQFNLELFGQLRQTHCLTSPIIMDMKPLHTHRDINQEEEEFLRKWFCGGEHFSVWWNKAHFRIISQTTEKHTLLLSVFTYTPGSDGSDMQIVLVSCLSTQPALIKKLKPLITASANSFLD